MSESKSSDEGACAELEVGSDDLVQPLCDPCGIEGSTALAEGFCKTCSEYLCGKCYKYHCKPKPMRHHILIEAQYMPKSKSTVEESDDSGEKCLKHVELPLKIYCKSHNDFGCILCLSEEHKTCENVSFIHDCAKGVASSKEYQDFKSELATLQASFKSEISKAETNVKGIDNVLSKLNTTEAASWLTILLVKVNEIDTKKDEIKTNGLQMTDSVITRCKRSLHQLDKFISDENSEAMNFMNMKRGQHVVVQSRTCLENVKIDNKPYCENVFLDDIEKCQSLMKSVNGCLELQKETPVSPNPTDLQENQSATQKAVIDIKVVSMFEVKADDDDEDDMDCRITGSAVLSDGRVALADFCNEAIKVMSPSGGHKFIRLEMEAKPFDVTEIHPGKLAVTLPSQRKLSILVLEEEDLAVDSAVGTSGPCYGIASAKNILYITVERPPKVEVIDINGTVLNTFAVDNNSQKLFASPWYLALDPVRDRIFVTDRDNDTLTCLTMEGKMVKVYKSSDMRRPYGVAVDGSGMVFVCARRSDKLVCLNPDFGTVKVIHDGTWLHKAESVAAWNKQDRLYIGLYRKDGLEVMDIQKSS